MTKGLYVTPNQFVSLSEITKTVSTGEFATRQNRYGDISAFLNILPDPDPILRKMGKDVTVYRDLLSDSHVISVTEQRKDAVKSFDWRIERGESKEKVHDFVKDAFQNLDVDEIIDQSLNSPLYGKTVFEKVWMKDGRYFVYEKYEEKPLEWFGFDTNNQLLFFTNDNIDGEVIIGKDAHRRHKHKWELVRHKYTYENPHGVRALAACFWPVAFKRGGMKFWVKMVEKYGMPFIVGKQPRGAGDEAAENMLDQLETMVQDAVAVIPDDSSVEINESKGAASSALYKDFRQANNDEISKAVLSQTLTTEVGEKGTYAASKTHENKSERKGLSDEKLAKKALNSGIKSLVHVNFSEDEICPEFDIYQEEDINKDLSERDETLVKQGVKFAKKYYVNNYNLKEDDFELKEDKSEEPNKKPLDSQITNLDTADELSEAAASKAIQDLISEAIPHNVLQKNMEQTLKPVMDLIKNSNNYDEAFYQLSELFPEMETNKTEDLLNKLFFISDLEGRISAQDESKM